MCSGRFSCDSSAKIDFIDRGKMIVSTNYSLLLGNKNQILIIVINAFLACFLEKNTEKTLGSKTTCSTCNIKANRNNNCIHRSNICPLVVTCFV